MSFLFRMTLGFLTYVLVVEDELPVWFEFFSRISPILLILVKAHIEDTNLLSTYLLHVFLGTAFGLTLVVSLLDQPLLILLAKLNAFVVIALACSIPTVDDSPTVCNETAVKQQCR